MGKKKTVDVDALSDFFGGDVDWLLDDETTSDLETGEELPVAPLPKDDPTAQVEPRPTPPPAPSPPPPARRSLGTAPTVPPQPAPEPPAELPLDPTVSTPGLLGAVDMPTLEVDATSEERTLPIPEEVRAPAPEAPGAVAPGPAPEPPQAPELEPAPLDEPTTGDVEIQFLAHATLAPEPLVASSTLAPERARPEPEPEVVPQRYAPLDEAAEWRAAVALLVDEAAVAPADERADLLFWAARLRRRRLGDEGGAAELLQDAAVAGYGDGRLHRERASAALLEERWSDAELAFADLAATREGIARSEAYQDAAGMAAQRGDAPAASRWLRAATEADPTDYIAWSLLRDQSAAIGDDATRLEAIERVAALAPDAVAADALWERGSVLLGQGDVAGARADWQRALARWPSHAPSLLSLRASFLEAGDHAGRGSLYEREATRPGQTDTGWWYLKAGRAFREAGNEIRARSLITAASALGDPVARRELQGFLRSRGDLAGLAEALDDEVRREKDRAAKAFAAWRLGLLREGPLGDRDGARAAYARAVEVDPSMEPAAEALARLAEQDGGESSLDAWAEQASAADPIRARALWLRVAETAERQGLPGRARAAWERLLDLDPADAVALEGLARAADAAGDVEAMAGAWGRLADFAADPREAAAWRYLAATGAPQRAPTDALRDAAGKDPANLVVTVVAVRALLAAGDVDGALDVLEGAAAASTGRLSARAWYRAARVASDRGDVERAQAAGARAVEADATFAPAVALAREIAERRGGARDRVAACRQKAAATSDPAARIWWRIAAVVLADGADGSEADLHGVLAEDPLHGGALSLLESLALDRRDWAALARAWRAAVDSDGMLERRAGRLAWLAELLQEIGDLDGARWALQELAQHNPGDAPLRGAARIAAAQHDWREAASLLRRAGQGEDLLERARILGHYVGDVPAALAAWRDLLPDPVFGPAAAVGILQVASAATDTSAARAAHRVLAGVGAPAFRAAHLAWAADLEEDEGDLEGALRLHREVLDLRPSSRTTFDAIRKLLVARRDREGLAALWAEVDPDDARGLAEDLEAAGDPDGAAEAWRRAAAHDGLPTLIELERALARVDDWRGVFDALRRQEARLRTPASRVAVEARKRWVLGEKLTGSHEAWGVYRSLHDEHPGDREVATALARIAEERGEKALAVQLWTELAATTRDPHEAVALRRRVAEAHEAGGDRAAARQAWIEVLDDRPDDAQAIEGLERLARQEGDDRSLEVAMRRRAALAPAGPERAAALRDVARLVEARGDDPSRASEAWQQVLEHSPDDVGALERLVALASSSGAWAAFVEHATALATVLDGPERGALLRRAGVACEDHLGRDPTPFYEGAVREEPPDREALRRLEALLERHGDEGGLVRCLKVHAMLPEVTPAERVALLARAATIESSILHEREVAADLWRQVLEIDPNHPGALAWLSAWLYEQGRLEAAGPLFERLEPHITEGRDLSDFDTRVELSVQRYRFGQLLARTHRLAEAVQRYEWALELNPTHLPSLEAVAPLYERLGRHEEAERAWRQVLQLIGGNAEAERTASAYAHLGLVERARGDGEKAFKRFNKALELAPNQIDALRGLALVFEDRGDLDNCMKAWNNVIYHATNRGDVVQAYLAKGRLLDRRMDRADKAAEHYQRCLDVDPANAGALARLAELSLRAQDWRAAEAWSHRGLRVEAEDPAVRADLLVAWALARAGQGDEAGARAALAEAKTTHPPLADALGADPLANVPAATRGLRERLA